MNSQNESTSSVKPPKQNLLKSLWRDIIVIFGILLLCPIVLIVFGLLSFKASEFDSRYQQFIYLWPLIFIAVMFAIISIIIFNDSYKARKPYSNQIRKLFAPHPLFVVFILIILIVISAFYGNYVYFRDQKIETENDQKQEAAAAELLLSNGSLFDNYYKINQKFPKNYCEMNKSADVKCNNIYDDTNSDDYYQVVYFKPTSQNKLLVQLRTTYELGDYSNPIVDSNHISTIPPTGYSLCTNKKCIKGSKGISATQLVNYQ